MDASKPATDGRFKTGQSVLEFGSLYYSSRIVGQIRFRFSTGLGGRSWPVLSCVV